MNLTLLFSALALAGGFVGNPADRKDGTNGAAWFLGNRSIRWCSDHADEVAPRLESALGTWRAYLAAKAIDRVAHPFSLTLVRLAACDGSEDLRVDRAADPLAETLSFSEQTSFDSHAGWAKGRLWVSPRAVGDALETQLLHQLGHLLGNGHVTGTVMASEVVQGIESHLSVDETRELYLCRACAFSAHAVDGREYYETAGSDAQVSGPGGLSLHFLSEIIDTAFGDAPVFTAVQGEWRSSFASHGLSRLARIGADDTALVTVQRNFDNLVEVRELGNGHVLFVAP
jgi:hypothetical protein